MKTEVNNTIYWKAINQDFRSGGIYSQLGNSEFRMMVMLLSYCDGYGIVCKPNNRGYDWTELSSMMGLDWRSVKGALRKLDDRKLIVVDDDNIIRIVGFVERQNLVGLTETPNKSEIKDARKRNKLEEKEDIHSIKNDITGLTRTINKLNASTNELTIKLKDGGNSNESHD